MQYGEEFFDAGIYRVGTRCEKWDGCREEHGEDTLPLWVADMDFASPTEVRDALLARAAHATYGYTQICPDDREALIGFWKRRHGLTVAQEDITELPCVVSGIKVAIQALTRPGDGVIIQSPVYGPFRFSVEATGRTLMDAPLRRNPDGRYDMDLDAVEQRLREGAKLMVLCSPHNPVSRLWSREELEALAALLDRYGVPLVSDEIHADFVYAPGQFVPILSVTKKNVMSLCAASKTFNLAGLQQAACLCPDAELREQYRRRIDHAGVTSGNIFALEGTRAAYQYGDAWLDGLMRYLEENRKCLEELVARELPEAVLTPMEATYLAWLDLRAWGMDDEELTARCEKAGVCFTMGGFFGNGGDGFARINIACPRRYLPEGIRRLKNALGPIPAAGR